MSGLRGWLKSVANSASEEEERKARESDSEMDGPLSVSMGILEVICLNAKERETKVRLRQVGDDRAIVAYLRSGDEEVVVELEVSNVGLP